MKMQHRSPTAPKKRSLWDQMGGLDAGAGERRKVRLLPDPEPQPTFRTIISVDDHIVEPPHLFEGRLPDRYGDRAPRIVEDEHGNQTWLLEGRTITTIGLSAVVGRDPR